MKIKDLKQFNIYDVTNENVNFKDNINEDIKNFDVEVSNYINKTVEKKLETVLNKLITEQTIKSNNVSNFNRIHLALFIHGLDKTIETYCKNFIVNNFNKTFKIIKIDFKLINTELEIISILKNIFNLKITFNEIGYLISKINEKNLKKNLIFIFENINKSNKHVLDNFLENLRINYNKTVNVLLLSPVTPIEILISPIFNKYLNPDYYTIDFIKNIYEKIIIFILFKSHFKFLLSRDSIEFINNGIKYNGYSITGIKLIFKRIVYYNSIKPFVFNLNSGLTDLNHNTIEQIRRSLFFKNYINSINKNNEIVKYFTDDNFTSNFINKEFNKFIDYFELYKKSVYIFIKIINKFFDEKLSCFNPLTMTPEDLAVCAAKLRDPLVSRPPAHDYLSYIRERFNKYINIKYFSFTSDIFENGALKYIDKIINFFNENLKSPTSLPICELINNNFDIKSFELDLVEFNKINFKNNSNNDMNIFYMILSKSPVKILILTLLNDFKTLIQHEYDENVSDEEKEKSIRKRFSDVLSSFEYMGYLKKSGNKIQRINRI